MIKLKGILLFIFTSGTVLTYGQLRKEEKSIRDPATVSFRDTIFSIAVDSISHNLGQILPTNDNNRLVKHFKYIGSETITITRAWTSDPHFICEYPKEPLIPNKIYSFTVCFWHQDRKGRMTKVMGFDLSDGNTISFTFSGTYIPIIKQDKIILRNGDTLIVQVTKTTSEFVEFTYPKDTLANSKHKNAIVKIIYAGGKEEVCSGKAPLPKIKDRDDWKKVLTTFKESDVKGLTKVGKITKTSGWGGTMATKLGYKDALKKIKKEAAKQGASIVWITGKPNNLSKQLGAGVKLTGIAYK